MTPTENWPKTFLLQCHEEAVKHGFLWIKPISEADAESLKSRLYRIRRRSDTSMAAFIPAEYHLVMIGVWEQEDGGRLPIIYDKRPDGQPLPKIVVPSGEEAAAFVPKPLHIDPVVVDLDKLDPALDEANISGIVDTLRKNAERRAAKKEQSDGEE